jgi:5-methylthioribose kinase
VTAPVLDEATVAALLVEFAVIDRGESIEVTELTGGVSSLVFLARGDTTSVVVKQALPQLKVQQVWRADPRRSGHEAAAARYLATLVPGSVPHLIAHDEPRHVVVMSAVDAVGTWKDELLTGQGDLSIAAQAGDMLGRIHHRSARDIDKIPAAIRHKDLLRELRTDPYFGQLPNSSPEVRDQLGDVVEQILTESTCLVHGDFSPKNILVTREREIVLVDHEVAHLGAPAFDVGFCCTHLIAKAHHLGAPHHVEVLRMFIDSYLHSALTTTPAAKQVASMTGALILARVDGKSRLEYLSETDRSTLRTVALGLLREPPDSFDELVAHATEGVHR